MPNTARAFIKTGFVFFMAALCLGVAMEIESLSLPALTPLFWHALMVGWITQIIFGVSLWMFPGRRREEDINAQLWAWLTYIFLNSGLILRFIAEPMLLYSPLSIWKIIVAGSALLQVTGGVTYVIEMWPRVQSKKQRLRKRKQNRNR